MDAGKWMVPLIVAVSAAPIFVIAGMVQRGALHLVNGLDPRQVRDPEALQRKLARLLAMIGFAIIFGSAGLVWAESDSQRVMAVVLAMVLAVNGLAVALIVAVARAKREQRPRR